MTTGSKPIYLFCVITYLSSSDIKYSVLTSNILLFSCRVDCIPLCNIVVKLIVLPVMPCFSFPFSYISHLHPRSVFSFPFCHHSTPHLNWRMLIVKDNRTFGVSSIFATLRNSVYSQFWQARVSWALWAKTYNQIIFFSPGISSARECDWIWTRRIQVNDLNMNDWPFKPSLQ